MWPSVEDVIVPILLRAGYTPLSEGVYKAELISSEVEHLIYLFQDYKLNELLFGDFGIRSASAEFFSCKAIHAYGGELFKSFRCGEPETCAMRFPFIRLDRSAWPIHLPTTLNNDLGMRFQEFLFGRLAPEIDQVNTVEKFLSLLIDDRPHCPWSDSNGAIRAAQIVFIARQLGSDADSVRSFLEPRKRNIGRGLSKTSEMRANPDKYIDRILNDWDMAGRVSHAG